MPFNLSQMLMESARILRGYYDYFLRPFKESPVHLQEVAALVELFEERSIGPKKLIEILERLGETDNNLNAYHSRIVDAWDRWLRDIDELGQNPLMLIDARNSHDCSIVLEILSLVPLMTQYEVLSCRNRSFYSLFRMYQEHPQLIAGFFECINRFPDLYQIKLFTDGSCFYESIFVEALRSNGNYLGRLLELMDSFNPHDYLSASEHNPIHLLKPTLELNPSYLPEVLKISMKLPLKSTIDSLISRDEHGATLFVRLLNQSSPEVLAQLIALLKAIPDPYDKFIVLRGGAMPSNVASLEHHPSINLIPLLDYLADDDCLPQSIMYMLITSFSKDLIYANLISFLLVFSRLEPELQNSALKKIAKVKGNVNTNCLLMDVIKDCPNLEIFIRSTNVLGNNVLMRAVVLFGSPEALPFLVRFLETYFKHHLLSLLSASNHSGDTLLTLAARNRLSKIDELLPLIASFDSGKRYQIMSRLNHGGKCAAAIAAQYQHNDAKLLRRLTDDYTRHYIAHYQSTLNLFQPAAAISTKATDGYINGLS